MATPGMPMPMPMPMAGKEGSFARNWVELAGMAWPGLAAVTVVVGALVAFAGAQVVGVAERAEVAVVLQVAAAAYDWADDLVEGSLAGLAAVRPVWGIIWLSRAHPASGVPTMHKARGKTMIILSSNNTGSVILFKLPSSWHPTENWAMYHAHHDSHVWYNLGISSQVISSMSCDMCLLVCCNT